METPDNSVIRRTAVDQVFDLVHKWLLSGTFQAGDVLPSQTELAKRFSVSRNTLREAMFKLAALGLVQSRQGVGTVVQAGAPSTYLGSISEQLLLEQITITEFIEARMFTEKAIVHLCVHRAGPELVTNLKANLEAQLQALEDRRDALFNDLDLQFHRELGEGCGNSVMRKFFQTSADLLSAFASKSYLVPGNLEFAYQGHAKIFKAIEQRDAAQAEEAMVWHIKEIALKTLKFLGLELEYELPQLR
ncbi:FadR/GntR family transcriptional regulator [Dethiosulfatarculus sandiegensis]|uniref:HTH gntR-type domain-containing protein n=1 Tax=Dethiosulfatarculus sandiegensis TaxID=1429043 RepID=A0A0D2K194_9BACT|nr:FadR/GntR family transcriptional regulator [Dethiosulfatarculus sandiegensis]KIX15450.1 hypothetical protein X474_04025 [Dethiosulfatarculus sandiegensis]